MKKSCVLKFTKVDISMANKTSSVEGNNATHLYKPEV